MESNDNEDDGKVLPFKKAQARKESENRFQRLYEEALAIEKEDAARSGNLGFMARSLVQATLPYREPKGNPPAWGRTNGEISLVIQPGYYFKKEAVLGRAGKKLREEQIPVSIGYPYGSNPRLILAWVATEVVRAKSRELVLGDSMTDFMSQIGIQNATGGKRGTITTLKEQMRRLFAANIAITTDPNSVNWANDGFRVADSSNFWWDPMQPDQPSLFQSTLVLSERFYKELLEHPVPIDLRALRALRQSPMAIDIYGWLTWRFYALSRRTQVPWEALQMQFGSEAKSIRKFKQTFTDSLKQVLTVYPEAKVETTTSSFILLPSNTSVPRVSKK